MNKPYWFCLISLLTNYFFHPYTSHAALSSITSNQSLSGDQTLVSKQGNFELGFFKPGSSSNYYIGMWYKKVSQRTYVWVANRDTPVSDKNSATLTISKGNLVLLDQSQNLVWSTNISSSANSGSEVAVLLDTGNLILSDRPYPSESEALWQSFDHPTDTWLPGGKIRLDNKTKKPQYLNAWRNNENPGTGLFSLELDPKGTNAYFILWNKSEQYWTSGPWNGQIFSLVPEMRLNYIYNFTFQSNENESYFTYSLYNSSIISRFVMDISGQVKQLSWLENPQQWNLFWSQPRKKCEVYAFCGAFGSCTENSMPFCNCLNGYEPMSQSDWSLEDHSGGCVRKTRFQCETSNPSSVAKDRFKAIPNMALKNTHAQSVRAGNAGECASICLGNCSCTAYAYDSNGCSIWSGDIVNLQQLSQDDSSGETLFLRFAASEFDDPKSNKGAIISVVAGAVGGIVVLLALVLIALMRRRRRLSGTGTSVEGSLVAFGYRDLQTATKNFSEKLGGGGFGSVFKGTLPDSSVIAVKKLESFSQGEKQFRTEVSTIGTVQHVNLVRLRGFCSEGARKLLVYDYMPNGSLDSNLFQEKDSKVLEWKIRYHIALGTARGLAYLHEKCRDCIIHCDVKPENILLDADFCPKVADFGLAKLVGRDFSRVLTTMRGTRGYLAPEWISGVAITTKADVYSYGMMLFEFVSGRRNSESSSEDGKVVRFFPTLAANTVNQGGNVIGLLDPKLEGNADIEELTRIIKVASWCVQDDETHRPSMGQVVQILEGVLDVAFPPVPRSLQAFVDNQENIVFFTDDSSSTQSSQVKSNVSTTSTQVKSNNVSPASPDDPRASLVVSLSSL